MSTTAAEQILPLSNMVEAVDQRDVVAALQQAYASETPCYPIGGATSLDYGRPAKVEGTGLSLAGLNRVVDYPARDMTITVEPGIRMSELSRVLAEERQQFPIDVPRAEQATLGGVIATNFNGARRYGLGTIRDFVIGIRAVDGQGRAFKGGGRVVKNVAGYDFCKLLTGSLGTLGVITQVTLKVRPVSAARAVVTMPVRISQAEGFLARLAESETTPAGIELLQGEAWKETSTLSAVAEAASDDDDRALLVVLLEGTAPEVDWMVQQLRQELSTVVGAGSVDVLSDPSETEQVRVALAEFPAGTSPLTLKASVVPRGVTRFMQACREADPGCSLQAHAGNGIVIMRFSEFPADGLSRMLIGRLAPTAGQMRGNVVVLSNPGGAEMTHQSVWGGIDAPYRLMTKVKKEFDPKNLLNPGRFVYV